MLPIIAQQSRQATSRVAMSARPDAPVVVAAATRVKPRSRSAHQALASLLRRSADRLSPAAE